MTSVENILSMLPDRLSSGKQAQIFTPPSIAKEMLDALPNEVWNKDTTFLDPCCKSGVFLHEIYKRLMDSDSMKDAFPDKTERRKHILDKQIFGIAMDDTCWMMTTRLVYGKLMDNCHIISFGNNYTNIMTNSDKQFLYKAMKERLGQMQFNIVIGNPPYNRGGGT